MINVKHNLLLPRFWPYLIYPYAYVEDFGKGVDAHVLFHLDGVGAGFGEVYGVAEGEGHALFEYFAHAATQPFTSGFGQYYVDTGFSGHGIAGCFDVEPQPYVVVGVCLCVANDEIGLVNGVAIGNVEGECGAEVVVPGIAGYGLVLLEMGCALAGGEEKEAEEECDHVFDPSQPPQGGGGGLWCVQPLPGPSPRGGRCYVF